MENRNGDKKHWIALLAPILGAAGALIAIIGPMLILGSQPGGPGNSIWPLPGLVLIDWAILGILGFLASYLGPKPGLGPWAIAGWFVAGGLMPLMILGALSIGPLVLLSLVFMVASSVLVAIHERLRLGNIAGAFALGLVINLGLILIPIVLVGNL